MDKNKKIKVFLNLREARKGLTQEKVAKLVNIDTSAITRYENGITEPSLNTLIKLAKALNVSTDYLLGVEHEQEKVAPEYTPEQLQVVELVKKLTSKELEKVYNYLLGIIDART